MQQRGYMILTSVLIVCAVALALGLSLKLQSIAETDIIRRTYNATSNFVAAQSCLEEALGMLRLNANYLGGTFTVGSTNCTITRGFFPRRMIVVATRESLVKRLEAHYTRQKLLLLVTWWKELP